MRYISFFLIGILMACSSGKEEKVKDLSDILPESERDYDRKDALGTGGDDTLEIYQKRFAIIGSLDSIVHYEEDLFPDRVGPEKMEKFRLFLGEDEAVFACFHPDIPRRRPWCFLSLAQACQRQEAVRVAP